MSLSVLCFVLIFFISIVSVCFMIPRLSCLLKKKCLRITRTSSTQGKITGYLPRALIWIGHFFVYHTCKKVRITYKYEINIDYYMAFFISHVISTRDAHISPCILWIWNQNIAISTIVGTSFHNMTLLHHDSYPISLSSYGFRK
jgi:hypothetical protein